MDIKRAVRLTLANLLRVIHIALWMTIPATFLSWFSGPEPSPRKCEPYCGYYQGNVLGISEDAHILIMLLLLLIGFIVWVCWVNGYCFEIVRHVLAGDTKLPPVNRGLMFDGFGLAWFSFKFWLPAIVLAIFRALDTQQLSTEGRRPYAWAADTGGGGGRAGDVLGSAGGHAALCGERTDGPDLSPP